MIDSASFEDWQWSPINTFKQLFQNESEIHHQTGVWTRLVLQIYIGLIYSEC